MSQNSPWRLLLTWSNWLRLRHPTLVRVNFIASPMFGIAFTLIALRLPYGLNFSGEFGVIHQVNGLLQILAPFFIGALAAISSFQREELDRPLGGQPPFLVEDGEEILPTRREFFGYLFGYLAALSVIIYAAGAVVMALASSAGELKNAYASLRHGFSLHAFRFVYSTALANLGLTTFLGLHFLIDYLPSRPFTPGARPLRHPVAPQAHFVPDAASAAHPPPPAG